MEKSVRSLPMDIVKTRALGKNRYEATIAANEKVRQPPDLEFRGLSTENYLRNPVVMWAHDSMGRSPSGGLPIGRTLKLNRYHDGLKMAEVKDGHLILRTKHHGETHVKIVSLKELGKTTQE